MTINLWAALVGVGAAVLLLAAGYLFGIRRGATARAAIHHRLEAQDTAGRFQLQELARSLQQHESTQRELESDMKRFLDRVSQDSTDTDVLRNDLRALLAPVIERDRDDRSLRSAVRELVGPLVQRERIGYDLAHLNLGTGRRDELPRILDEIAEKGGFSTVLLTDDDGLPLAVSHGAHDIERLAGICSLVMLVADRLSRDAGPAPLAVAVHDADNRQLLSRLFDVAGQSLLLTAVAAGTNLSPTALDPALGRVKAVLAPVHTQ